MAKPRKSPPSADGRKPAKPKPQTPGPGRAAGEVPEVGGRKGPDPTRYGDWEKDGRCVDF